MPPATTRDRTSAELEANKPDQKILAPLPSRHSLDGITRRSQVKDKNSVTLPSVNMVEETDLIRRGYGDFLGNSRWRINNRVYIREGTPQGRLIPESGEGIISLTRAEFKALVILVKYNGYTDHAARELRYSEDITPGDIEIARELHAQRTKKP
jgi:hypothetical protein